jgi:pimeloyl-ACP methyl ester carboxylesterase
MTPLVLVPGMMCDHRMWGAIPRALSPQLVHHALPVGDETMAGIAAAVLATAPPRFALAGLSLGGIVAMEMLHQAPERIERLALFDTNPLAEIPEVQARRATQIARVMAGELESVMREDMKPNYLADPRDTATLDLCLDMARALGPEVFRRQSLALRDRADRTGTLARFRGPALVLMGEHDRLCPRDRHELMRRLMPQSRLEIVRGAAHLPPLERPGPTATAIKSWLGA